MPDKEKELEIDHTAFLTWKQNSKDLWIAKDPVNPNKRWVIRDVAGYTKYRAICVTVNDKNHSEAYVCATDFLARAKWECVGECIKKLAENLYTSVSNEGDLDYWIKAYEFIDNLTTKWRKDEQAPVEAGTA